MTDDIKQKNPIDIESYAKHGMQYYSAQIPALLKKYLTLRNYDSLLDCGCGDGGTLYALKNQGFLKNKEVYAIDLSVNRIGIIKKIDPNIKAFTDNAETMDRIQNNSIDFLISEQVIEHIDQVKMLDSIYRVVKKHGTIYISTVFKLWYGWYFYRNNGKWVLDPTHIREYQHDRELFNFIDNNKFEIIENKKKLIWFPIIDSLIKRFNIKDRSIFNNNILYLLRKIKRPVPGYYYWEIILKKK